MTPAPRTRTAFLIAFIDLTRFDAQAHRVDDAQTADVLDEYYQRVTRAVEGAGGVVVKFIGDAALIVFRENVIDAGVRALFDLQSSVDRWMSDIGWECRLMFKAHFGDAIAGDFGAEGSRRFDVIGRAVNDTARLKSTGVTLSPEALRKLSPGTRKQYESRAQNG